MFGKKKLTKEQKAELKKRKFLSKKFYNAASMTKITAVSAVTFAGPAAFIDGGFSLVILCMVGGVTGTTTALLAIDDMVSGSEYKIEKTKSGQKVYGQVWAHGFYNRLENELIKTCDDLKYLSNKDVKKSRKLQKKKDKLLDVARDLAEYLSVANHQDQPTNQPLVMMTREPTENKAENRIFQVQISAPKADQPRRGPSR